MLKLYFFYAGIMITGSHNRADENGFKLEGSGANLTSEDSGQFGLLAIGFKAYGFLLSVKTQRVIIIT